MFDYVTNNYDFFVNSAVRPLQAICPVAGYAANITEHKSVFHPANGSGQTNINQPLVNVTASLLRVQRSSEILCTPLTRAHCHQHGCNGKDVATG